MRCAILEAQKIWKNSILFHMLLQYIFLLFIIVSEEECYNVVFEAAFTWQQRTKDAYKHRQKNNFIHNLIFRTKIKSTKFTTDFFLYLCWEYFKRFFA